LQRSRWRMSDTALYIDSKDLDAAVAKLKIPPDQQRRVMRSAVTKTARWAATRFRGKLGKGLGISGTVINSRMVVDIKSAEYGHARVWLGLKPIGLHRLNPRETASGVTTDVVSVYGAFIALDPRIVFKRQGRTRLKIDKQTLPIEDRAAPIIADIFRQVEAKLAGNFERAYEQVLGK